MGGGEGRRKRKSKYDREGNSEIMLKTQKVTTDGGAAEVKI